MKKEHQLKSSVEKFNSIYKIGDKVEVLKRKNGIETFTDTIKHEATIMGGHTAVIWLKEKGSYDLTFVCRKIDILTNESSLG